MSHERALLFLGPPGGTGTSRWVLLGFRDDNVILLAMADIDELRDVGMGWQVDEDLVLVAGNTVGTWDMVLVDPTSGETFRSPANEWLLLGCGSHPDASPDESPPVARCGSLGMTL
ncbi:MAG: hypothetical protein AB2A00_33730 [Myxococcota bacterium]